MQPRLIFFCELTTPDLQRLFEDEQVVLTLQRIQAGTHNLSTDTRDAHGDEHLINYAAA